MLIPFRQLFNAVELHVEDNKVPFLYLPICKKTQFQQAYILAMLGIPAASYRNAHNQIRFRVLPQSGLSLQESLVS